MNKKLINFQLTQLTELLIIIMLGLFTYGCENNQKSYESNSHQKLNDVIKGFNLCSYYAGSTFTAAEFVSAGCKKLALSAPYSGEELAMIMKPTQMASEEYHVPIYIETDFLTTKLFDSSLTKEKIVVLIAQNQNVLDDYFALKEQKKKAVEENRLKEIEDELAWKFGRLLSYSDEKITSLIAVGSI